MGKYLQVSGCPSRLSSQARNERRLQVALKANDANCGKDGLDMGLSGLPEFDVFEALFLVAPCLP